MNTYRNKPNRESCIDTYLTVSYDNIILLDVIPVVCCFLFTHTSHSFYLLLLVPTNFIVVVALFVRINETDDVIELVNHDAGINVRPPYGN